MKQIIEVKGMHCHSCEILIEDKLKQVSGVQKVTASSKKSVVTIFSDVEVSRNEIAAAVKAVGYQVGKSDLPFVKANYRDLTFIVVSFLTIGLLYFMATKLGLAKALTFGAAGPSTSLAVIFTIGVTAGLSSCMALVGGLVLGASARYAEKHPDATPAQKFRPHLFFNLGRIIAFFALGGLIGSLGSFLKLSSSFTGFFMIIVGIFMLFLGIQLLEIFPRLTNVFTLPKSLSRLLGLDKATGAEYSHKNSMILGGLTFFLPCGFTQAMQVYAISTGSFVSGAMIMGVFALGTTPGLLSVGGLTSVLKKGGLTDFFYKFIGVLVILLALYNLSNGFTLSGLKNSFQSQTEPSSSVGMVVPNGEVQVAKATYDKEETLTPKKFTFKVGQPVRIEILAKDDGFGCMGSVMIPNLVSQPQFFVKGQTVKLEFTPKSIGKYTITCAMGVPAGTVEIVK